MTLADKLAGTWKDTFSVHRVFGDAIEKDGATIIPVAMVAGATAGGGGSKGEADGADTGGVMFGVARPAGAYVIRGESVQWQPALDITLLGMAGIALTALMTLVIGKAIRRRR
jgi:uncharacterized spore protein YtfJ